MRELEAYKFIISTFSYIEYEALVITSAKKNKSKSTSYKEFCNQNVYTWENDVVGLSIDVSPTNLEVGMCAFF